VRRRHTFSFTFYTHCCNSMETDNNMDKRMLSTLCLLAFTGITYAQSSRITGPGELTVSGTLTAPACQVIQSDNGDYDYGRIDSNLIPVSGSYTHSSMVKMWSVQCDADTHLSFKAIDNAASTSAGTGITHFGLGSNPSVEDSKLGYYTVLMRNAKVDGADTNLYAINGTPIAGSAAVYVHGDGVYSMGWAKVGAVGEPHIGRSFVVDMEVTPVFAHRGLVGPIADDVPLAGSLSLTFQFGI